MCKIKIENLDVVKVAQIPVELVNKSVLSVLAGKESFVDNDKSLGENIYAVSTLEELLLDAKTQHETILHINEIFSVVKAFEYVMFTKV